MKYNVSYNCMLVSHQIYPNFTNESGMSHVLVGFLLDARVVLVCRQSSMPKRTATRWLLKRCQSDLDGKCFARNITSNWLNWFHSICWTSYVFQDLDGNSGWMLFFFGWIDFMISSFLRQIINHRATTFNNQHQFLRWINIQKYPILHTMKLFVEYRMDSSQPVPLLVHLNIS